MGEFVCLLLPAATIITVYRHYWGAGRSSAHVVPAGIMNSSQLGVLTAMETLKSTGSDFGAFEQRLLWLHEAS